MKTTERLIRWGVFTMLSGAIVFDLSACAAPTHAAVPPRPIAKPWEDAMDSCRIVQGYQEGTDPSIEETLVACKLPDFKKIMQGALDLHEALQLCDVDRQEMSALCLTDKKEMQGEINVLDDKLGKWYRNPWIWLGISLGVGAVGFGVGFGLAK